MPTTPPSIAALPTPPSRDDPTNFAARGDAFLGALPTFRSETNSVASNVYANAVEAASSAVAAGQSASDAAAAAAASLAAGTGITGTSTTSLAIGSGSKSLTIETGRDFVAGMPVRIGQAGANANVNFMDGDVTSYNTSTGALVVNVTGTGGSGTINSWSVRAISPPSLPFSSAESLAQSQAIALSF
jgi:hypothetical protein